jgi:methylmalonyl-CoA/ethylmalonyl-CoA epimerase
VDKRLLDEDEIMQLCFVTDDVQKSARWFADLVGKEIPPEGKAAEPDEARAIYEGKPATVGCRIIMFKFGNIDFEFLQPGPEKSAWRDILEQKGPGFHHLAFRTRNMTQRGQYLESKGHKLLQSGEFDGGHGRYAYFDTIQKLGAMIELLEFDKDKEPQS